MDILGAQVKHFTFGTGKVITQENNMITIEFAAKTTKFVFPDCFEKFVTATDPNLQERILADIEARMKTKSAAIAPKTKPAGTTSRIDTMFDDDYHVSFLARHPVLTYQQVEAQFGINISGFGRGINPTDTTVVLISSINKTNGRFTYHDRWAENGDYIYSGEGRTGNQQLTKGNLAIVNAKRDHKAIHLFVKFSPREYYYQGIFELAGYTYETEEDETGGARKEYKFRLRKTNQ